MVVATVGGDGWPAARTVLLKGYDAAGLRFFTNTGSAKAAELAANPRAALVFPWHPAQRQVRVTGTVERLPDDVVAAYFATRPRDSQLGAWASPQSTVVADRAELDRRLAEVDRALPGGRAGAGAAALGRLPGGAGRLGVLGRPRGAPARPAALRTAGGIDRALDPGPPGSLTEGPRPEQQRPPGLTAQGTCPAQARGSGDCLGFAGSNEKPVIRSASGAARGASWQPPHASDKYSSVRTTSLPCTDDRTSRKGRSQRISAVSRSAVRGRARTAQTAIQVDSACPRIRPSVS